MLDKMMIRSCEVYVLHEDFPDRGFEAFCERLAADGIDPAALMQAAQDYAMADSDEALSPADIDQNDPRDAEIAAYIAGFMTAWMIEQSGGPAAVEDAYRSAVA